MSSGLNEDLIGDALTVVCALVGAVAPEAIVEGGAIGEAAETAVERGPKWLGWDSTQAPPETGWKGGPGSSPLAVEKGIIIILRFRKV